MDAPQIFQTSAESFLDLSLMPEDVDFAIFTPTDDSVIEEVRNGLGMGASVRYLHSSYAFAAPTDAHFDDNTLHRLDFLAGTSMFFIETNKDVAICVLDTRCKSCKTVCTKMQECPDCQNVRYCGMVCQIRDHFHRVQCPQLALERVYFQSVGRMLRLANMEILTMTNFTIEFVRRYSKDAESSRLRSSSALSTTGPPPLPMPQLLPEDRSFELEDWEYETME